MLLLVRGRSLSCLGSEVKSTWGRGCDDDKRVGWVEYLVCRHGDGVGVIPGEQCPLACHCPSLTLVIQDPAFTPADPLPVSSVPQPNSVKQPLHHHHFRRP